MKPWETLTMSRKEVPRTGLLRMVLAGKVTNAQGAAALRVSPRHVQRLKARFQAEGAPGLLHRRARAAVAAPLGVADHGADRHPAAHPLQGLQ
jgi:hypothetical protein